MKVIQARVRIGADRTLNVHLPEDVPEGDTRVVVMLEPAGDASVDAGDWKAAAERAAGSLRYLHASVHDLIDERRADDVRDEARWR